MFNFITIQGCLQVNVVVLRCDNEKRKVNVVVLLAIASFVRARLAWRSPKRQPRRAHGFWRSMVTKFPTTNNNKLLLFVDGVLSFSVLLSTGLTKEIDREINKVIAKAGKPIK